MTVITYFMYFIVGMFRIAIFKIRPEPDITGYQMNYPAGTGYLNTFARQFVWFCVWYEYESIIPRACCFQLCVKLHRSTTIKELGLVYMTQSLQEYKSLVLCQSLFAVCTTTYSDFIRLALCFINISFSALSGNSRA